MPELPEVHRYSNVINENCGTLTFSKVTGDGSKYEAFPLTEPVTISSKTRGKELCLYLTTLTGKTNTFCWNHGLVGKWRFSLKSEVPPHARLQFSGEHDYVLSYVDAMKMGSWRVGSFAQDRSPDPINEHREFCMNILSKLDTAAMKHPICTVMLNQDYFNGIGNYLRAEILHRACVHPSTPANVLFGQAKNLFTSFDFNKVDEKTDRGLLVLYLCKAIPEEVLEKGLDKYGSPEEVERFTEWLRIYGKGNEEKIAGRKMHFAKITPMTPDLPRPKPSSSNISPASVNRPDTPSLPGLPTAFNVPPGFSIFGPRIEQTADGQFSGPGTHPPTAFGHPTMSPFTQPIATESLTKRPVLDPEVDDIMKKGKTNVVASILLLINYLHKTYKISLEDKEALKTYALAKTPAIVSAYEMFTQTHDLAALVNSLKLISQTSTLSIFLS
eukprot:TRINITY_DN5273_c0_g1_i2.p1 TRINITY_DN5273_c0_g1~~TRINITY_DN5273_c0_g1_i2.p1  ORF type:complete len:442 (+),score=43.60 TRINITY_DN5273_c0_g1_i2:65-1390(+)